MKLAVFADVHSNIEALKAVLDEIKKEQADKVICAGDLVGYAPFPNEVINLMRETGIDTIMGNYDDGVGNMRIICGCDYKDENAQRLGEQSIQWTKKEITEENKEFLRKLPHNMKLAADDFSVLIVHGSPRQLNEYLREEADEDYLLELLTEAQCDILVCGHTHKPFYKDLGNGKFVVNVGSVGKPKHGSPNAVYAVLEIRDIPAVEFKEVPYDYEKTAQAIESSTLPDGFAQLIRKGIG